MRVPESRVLNRRRNSARAPNNIIVESFFLAMPMNDLKETEDTKLMPPLDGQFSSPFRNCSPRHHYYSTRIYHHRIPEWLCISCFMCIADSTSSGTNRMVLHRPRVVTATAREQTKRKDEQTEKIGHAENAFTMGFDRDC